MKTQFKSTVFLETLSCTHNNTKMKVVICLVALISVSLAAPADDPKAATVLRYENANNEGNDGYKFDFETSNGIVREEQGQLKNIGTDDEGIAVRGSYTYTVNTPEGARVTYTVTYTADENGFVPVLSEKGVL